MSVLASLDVRACKLQGLAITPLASSNSCGPCSSSMVVRRIVELPSSCATISTRTSSMSSCSTTLASIQSSLGRPSTSPGSTSSTTCASRAPLCSTGAYSILSTRKAAFWRSQISTRSVLKDAFSALRCSGHGSCTQSPKQPLFCLSVWCSHR